MARKITTPAETTVNVNAVAETVAALSGTGRRNIRDAALEVAAAEFGPFTIIEEVKLPSTEAKFSAWITGARGRNGWIIEGRMGKAVVGVTTVRAFIEMGSVTNGDMVDGGAGEAKMKGIIG